mgnify:FL=1
MGRFIIRTDGDDEIITARDITEAVEEYARAHDGEGWSDHFDVVARGECDTRWRVFPVGTRQELVVDVGDPTPGPLVTDDAAGAQ